MDTKKWGPLFWFLLQDVAYTAQRHPSRQQHFDSLFSILPYVLPCSLCRKHCKHTLKKDILPRGNVSPRLYVHKFHNVVNLRLKKPQYSMAKAMSKKQRLSSTVLRNAKQCVKIIEFNLLRQKNQLLHPVLSFQAFFAFVDVVSKLLNITQQQLRPWKNICYSRNLAEVRFLESMVAKKCPKDQRTCFPKDISTL